MADTPPDESPREQARRHREAQEVEEHVRRAAQKHLARCRRAIDGLKPSTHAMRLALGPSPPAAEELQEHYDKVTSLLADALAALREADLLTRLDQLDEAATLAHYRQQRDDPQEAQIAYAHAKQIIGADPADRQRLTQLVRDTTEEPGLRLAWDWVYILLDGLTGQQHVAWKQEAGQPMPPTPAAEGKGVGGAKGTMPAPTIGQPEGVRRLKKSRETAYRLFQWALDQKPELKTDREVYDWLNDHQDLPEELPSFASWSRYLREARDFHDDHKHAPRSGRPTGKSIVPKHQLDRRRNRRPMGGRVEDLKPTDE
jgi:hypothetical protein